MGARDRSNLHRPLWFSLRAVRIRPSSRPAPIHAQSQILLPFFMAGGVLKVWGALLQGPMVVADAWVLH